MMTMPTLLWVLTLNADNHRDLIKQRIRVMIFWGSSEAFQPAAEAETKVQRVVEAYLNAAFSKSVITSFACKLRYIPIIMPTGMKERYPARSKLRKKERLYDCAPQLDYETFVSGTFEEQLREYIRGITETGPHLLKLGATQEQVDEFDRILARAVERILVERPDQTRH